VVYIFEKNYTMKAPQLIIGFFILVLTSCTKEGPMGPMGPAGPAGPVGPTGPAGSVVYSRTFTVNANQWTWNSTLYTYYIDLSFPEITAAFLPNCSVVGYIQNGANIWSVLPNTFYPIVGSNVSRTFEISYITTGIVRLRLVWSDSRQTAPTTAEIFNIVAIGK
jgi:hypothetical protein